MGKIIGNTTATPNPRPDWNQTDVNKADYIKNKPDNLPNPYALTFTGAATGTYDGSEATTINIPVNDGADQVALHNEDSLAHPDIRTALNNKADRTQALFYIEGDSSSTTDTTNKVATWIGSHDEITEYFDGLTILYKVVTAGSTTTTLNINGLGATTVVRNATTGISTACPVDGILLLTYTVDSSGTAYWKTADYDVNTKNTAGTSNKTGTKMYLVGGTSQTSSGTTTYTNSNIYINTSNELYSAKGFSGDLTGTATKATQDASGNVITSTYETKADATTKINNINTQIGQLSSEIANLSNISLGIASDGLIYIFINGMPVGTGIPQGQSGDVFGYVDENNTVVLKGDLIDGTYAIKYEMEDGSILNIGTMVLDTNVYYSITKNLTNSVISNNTISIAQGDSYSATISANSGYELSSIVVTMGGTDITSSAVSGGNITIVNVTGNIVITAIAEETVVEITNLLPLSVDASGNLYVGTNGEKGYKRGFKISTSSGNEGAVSATNACVSGFIKLPEGKQSQIRIKNIVLSNYTGGTINNIVFYKADKTLQKGVGGIAGAFDPQVTVSNGAYLFETKSWFTTNNLPTYFRFSCGEITDETIVTIDQEIV